jgi:hypothetical protein
MEDVLARVDQRIQGLCTELNQKADETEVGLQAERTSDNMQTKSFQKTLAHTRKDLHEEHGLMF